MKAKDYYAILGVPETAGADEIKKAYRKIARDSHPDRNPGNKAAEERFKEASEAYDILGDAEKRKKFDALRRYGYGTQGGGQGFEGFPFGGPGGTRYRWESGDMRDMDFADLFGEQFADVFEQIFQQMGGAPGGGRSRVRVTRSQGRPRSAKSTNGKSRPAELDPFFRAEGLDVHCTVWLKLDQLERGARVRVKTPSGKKAIVNVHPGTKIGTVLRLPGLGLTAGARRGDQYVHLEALA
jgi:DnaJ-class molecular chaperone